MLASQYLRSGFTVTCRVCAWLVNLIECAVTAALAEASCEAAAAERDEVADRYQQASAELVTVKHQLETLVSKLPVAHF